MLLDSTMGIFEETITLVPITIAQAMMLKWDSLVGIGMSVLAVGFGFSAGTLNPFTLGVAQTLADVPMFSGLLFRIVVFIVVYLLLVTFLITYAGKIEGYKKLFSNFLKGIGGIAPSIILYCWQWTSPGKPP